jgi:hypothetical protein
MRFMKHYISFRKYWDSPAEHSAVIKIINEWIGNLDPKDYQWAYAKFMFREQHKAEYSNPLGLSLQNETDLLAFKIKFGHMIGNEIDY